MCDELVVTFGRGTLPHRSDCNPAGSFTLRLDAWPRDTDLSTRWSLVKGHFSRAIEKDERISQSRAKRGERGLWQRRFWEHLIRDQADFNHPVDYVHWNPVRHGGVRRVSDWPHSSMRSGGEGSIRRFGVARTSQVLRQGRTRAMRFSSFTASCASWPGASKRSPRAGAARADA